MKYSTIFSTGVLAVAGCTFVVAVSIESAAQERPRIASPTKVRPDATLVDDTDGALVDKAPARFEFRKDDGIVFVGNTFTERLVKFGNFETILYAHRPDLNLKVRNLGWSADTPSQRPRPLNFGDVHTHLENQKADVIILCFGMNDSFNGKTGLEDFKQNLTNFIGELKSHKYNGKTPPRLLLVGPIGHENLGGDLPDPSAHNENLKLYNKAMSEVAIEAGVPFVDLLLPTTVLMQRAEAGRGDRLTFNGIHVTEYGDWVVAGLLAAAVGLNPQGERVEIESAAKNFPLKLELADVEPAYPPPPAGANVDPALTRLARRVKIDVGERANPQTGRYALRHNGKTLAVATLAEWEDGVNLFHGPWQNAAAELRDAIVEKNEQFYYRYRAVNGEYIYGRRKQPFGVISFPPEMKKLEEIIADLDKKIWYLSKSRPGETLELAPASNKN